MTEFLVFIGTYALGRVDKGFVVSVVRYELGGPKASFEGNEKRGKRRRAGCDFKKLGSVL